MQTLLFFPLYLKGPSESFYVIFEKRNSELTRGKVQEEFKKALYSVTRTNTIKTKLAQ